MKSVSSTGCKTLQRSVSGSSIILICCLVPLLFCDILFARSGDLPSAFDLRDVERNRYVTSIKNQGNYGTCWAHAVMAAIESHVLVRETWEEVPGEEPNFAEYHLDWWNGFNTFSNKDVFPEQNGLWVHWGGDYRIATAYLSRCEGVVYSPDANDDTEYDRNWLLLPPPLKDEGFHTYYIEDIEWYMLGDGIDGIDIIKNKIRENGAIGTCMYAASVYMNDYIHYQPVADNNDPNHAVTIVGWDDALETQAPEGAGAWLVKNSWGSGWGNDGYFWISYYDKQCCRHPEMGAVSFQNIEPLQYTRVYSRDYHGWRDTREDCSEAFNAFVAEEYEFLKSVSFYTADDSVTYEIRVYDRFEEGELREERSRSTGFIDHTGFHTVDLPETLFLREGDDFYLYLWLSRGGQAYDRTSEVEVLLGTNQSGTVVESTASPGQSYYWDGFSWQDLWDVDETANFCIKGLAVEDIDTDGAIEQHALFYNFPNPFNESTTIKFEVSETSRVVLKIYNLTGQEVITLIDEVKQPGRKWITWDGRDRFGRGVSSGVFVYRLQVSDQVFTKKMVMVR